MPREDGFQDGAWNIALPLRPGVEQDPRQFTNGREQGGIGGEPFRLPLLCLWVQSVLGEGGEQFLDPQGIGALERHVLTHVGLAVPALVLGSMERPGEEAGEFEEGLVLVLGPSIREFAHYGGEMVEAGDRDLLGVEGHPDEADPRGWSQGVVRGGMPSLVMHEGDGFHQVEEFGGQGRRSFGSSRSTDLKGEVAQPVRDGMILEVGVAGEEVGETGGDGEGSVGVPGQAAEAGVEGGNHRGILQ